MPTSQHKYIYERLEPTAFQQLIATLLTNALPGYTPMALGQSDGGRDGIRKLANGRRLIYQVKWSQKGTERNAVTWLESVIKAEEANLKRLASEGIKDYCIVTNVVGSAKPGVGTYDKFEAILDSYAKKIGFERMDCYWRDTVNSWVDAAPAEVKWAYPDMLAGTELIRYLLSDQTNNNKITELRNTIQKVIFVQWEQDKKVKFAQSDIDAQAVTDLFVDVTADQVSNPPLNTTHAESKSASLGGAAKYLLNTTVPFTLVRGAPGQGKSTLSQYICQVYRRDFLPENLRPKALPTVEFPRFPIRIDLSDYAIWISGGDIGDIAVGNDRKPNSRRRMRSKIGLEKFLAEKLAYDSGRDFLTSHDVADMLERLPICIVLDGLDEVGSPEVRDKIVKEIDRFAARSRIYQTIPKIIVTSRPSAGKLPEPSGDLFEVISLNQLTEIERTAYLAKWCRVRNLPLKEANILKADFAEKSKEPYVAELASNPMQLTILLDLLRKHGSAAPTQRTQLYDDYVELLLAREANKHPTTVREYKDELVQIVPFLGWYIQALSEESQIEGRMTLGKLKAAIRHFQTTYGKRESIVDELFEGASARLWALTSKVESTFEFEVLSLREYFAASFLFENAGDVEEAEHMIDNAVILAELLIRPYWLNTARFYSGKAKGKNIYALTAGIEQALQKDSSGSTILGAWTLLTDGVFQPRPLEARKVISTLLIPPRNEVLLQGLATKDILPLPALPNETENDPDPTWDRLTSRVSANPTSSNSVIDVRVIRELLNQADRFSQWWLEKFTELRGTEKQSNWLRLGATIEAANGSQLNPDALISNLDAEALLNCGFVVECGTPAEAALLRAIFDGQCQNVTSIKSIPSQIAISLAPRNFVTAEKSRFVSADPDYDSLRTQAIRLLSNQMPEFADVAKKRIFAKGQFGGTFPWANTATALFDLVGRCYLASAIAIIGAASPLNLDYTKNVGSMPFGVNSHPTSLMAQTRINADNKDWWRAQLANLTSDLSNAEFFLSIWCVTKTEVIIALASEIKDLYTKLTPLYRKAIEDTITMLSETNWLVFFPDDHQIDWGALNEFAELRMAKNNEPERFIETHKPGKKTEESKPSLIEVARRDKWLKVDNQDTVCVTLIQMG